MGKKKSLGSSPIGFQSENGSMNFIPDLGVKKTKKAQKKTSKYYSKRERKQVNGHPDPAKKFEKEESPPEKKIVSYNLEVELIERVKDLADKKDMYYSTLVSKALKYWISENSNFSGNEE